MINKEANLIWIVLVYSLVLLSVLGVVSYLIWNQGELIIMYVPVPILQWAFVGGMVGVLYQLVFKRDRSTEGTRFYAWLVAKPVVGLVMGAIVYFLAVSGELALNGRGQIKNIEFLNLLAFLGGFSDRFSVDLLNRIVSRSRAHREHSRGETK
jgi:hypothetical protein